MSQNEQPKMDPPFETDAAASEAPAAEGTASASPADGLDAKLAEANDKMLRALAEVENIRRRAERDRQDISKFAVSSFARDLLSVADNMHRALQAITPEQRETNEALKNIYIGVEATERELMRLFEKNGIKKQEPLDQKFDPNLHEVMFEAEVPGKAPGTVIQIIEPGYTIHERLLRPARVGVAKGDGSATSGHLNAEV